MPEGSTDFRLRATTEGWATVGGSKLSEGQWNDMRSGSDHNHFKRGRKLERPLSRQARVMRYSKWKTIEDEALEQQQSLTSSMFQQIKHTELATWMERISALANIFMPSTNDLVNLSTHQCCPKTSLTLTFSYDKVIKYWHLVRRIIVKQMPIAL